MGVHAAADSCGMLGIAWLLLLLSVPARAEPGSWTSLNSLAATYGLTAPLEQSRSIILRRPNLTLTFDKASRRMTFNGVTCYLNTGVIWRESDWWIARLDACDTVGALLRPAEVLRTAGGRLIVLDPGHGGSDSGAREGPRLVEKRLTLDIARRVRSKLKACGVDAVLTRDRDIDLGLDARTERARRLGADVFVSIHLNAARDRRVAGIETYVIPAAGVVSTASSRLTPGGAERTVYAGNNFDAANMILAYLLHHGLLVHSQSGDRGIRRARFQVLKTAPCPAALVECGFLSNRQEAERLAEEGYRDQLAEGIARGLLTYVSRVREAQLPMLVEK